MKKTLQDWINTYYPISASAAIGSDIEALDHSIRKWSGLGPDILKQHNVEQGGAIRGRYILLTISSPTEARQTFSVTDSSCALCKLDDLRRSEDGDPDVCANCPLVQCGEHECGADGSPYSHWIDTGDNIPMLETLIRVRRKLTE